MSETQSEISSWHDWTHPDFFMEGRQREARFLPLFMRQIMPGAMRRTRLTLIGWMLILVSIGIGSAAYNASSNILFMTLALVLSSLVLSGMLSLINFRKLDWQLNPPRHLRVGEPSVLEIELHNRKEVLPSMCMSFHVQAEGVEESDLYLHSALAPRSSCTLEWNFVPVRRGLCELNLSGAESQFPFGFLSRTVGQLQTESVLVWPERVDYSFEPSGGGVRFLSGASRRKPGVGSDLLNLRPYQRGDAPRLVHWKASARMGKLMVRQFAQEGESGFHLLVDAQIKVSSEEQFDRFCALVCSLAEDLYHLGRLESVYIGSETVLKVSAVRDLHDVLDAMAALEAGVGGAPVFLGAASSGVRFRMIGEEVGIYVGDEQAGQTYV